MALTQKSTQTLWRLCNFLNHTINVTIYVNLKKKFAKLPTLIIEIFPLKEMELKLPAQNHSRSQSFDPFGQQQGSRSIPAADQKDRSSGNENGSKLQKFAQTQPALKQSCFELLLWMNKHGAFLSTQGNWFAQFARILARQLFVGVDKWANGGWLIDQ